MSKLFSVVYDPPADGLWGAYDAGTGNMSGLIGQAAYGDVDMVMTRVMITQDRSRVADATIAFDSNTMVCGSYYAFQYLCEIIFVHNWELFDDT